MSGRLHWAVPPRRAGAALAAVALALALVVDTAAAQRLCTVEEVRALPRALEAAVEGITKNHLEKYRPGNRAGARPTPGRGADAALRTAVVAICDGLQRQGCPQGPKEFRLERLMVLFPEGGDGPPFTPTCAKRCKEVAAALANVAKKAGQASARQRALSEAAAGLKTCVENSEEPPITADDLQYTELWAVAVEFAFSKRDARFASGLEAAFAKDGEPSDIDWEVAKAATEEIKTTVGVPLVDIIGVPLPPNKLEIPILYLEECVKSKMDKGSTKVGLVLVIVAVVLAAGVLSAGIWYYQGKLMGGEMSSDSEEHEQSSSGSEGADGTVPGKGIEIAFMVDRPAEFQEGPARHLKCPMASTRMLPGTSTARRLPPASSGAVYLWSTHGGKY